MEEKNKNILNISSKETLEKFSEKMSEIALKEKEQETKAKAAMAGFPYLNLKGFPISPETIIIIPEEKSAKLKAVCFYFMENRPVNLT